MLHLQDPISLQTSEEYTDNCDALFAQASRHIRIRSYALDPTLFNTDAFSDLLSQFARRSKFSTIQILLDEPEHLLKYHSRILQLTRRLSSKISIRAYFDEPNPNRDSLILFDSQALLIKPSDVKAQGCCTLNDAVYCKRMIETFDYEWQLSTTASTLRQLSL